MSDPRTITRLEPGPLTAEQAAAYLGVSLSVLKQLTADGWIPVVGLRRGVRRDLTRRRSEEDVLTLLQHRVALNASGDHLRLEATGGGILRFTLPEDECSSRNATARGRVV